MEVKELEGVLQRWAQTLTLKKKKGEEERTQPQHMVLGSWVVGLGTSQSSELVYPMPLLAVGLYHGQV